MSDDPATAAVSVPEIVPAHRLNEYTYCPRLAYLQWAQQEWADNRETMEGKEVHRRVDQPEGPRAKIHQRSLHLTSERLGITAVCDLVESDGRRLAASRPSTTRSAAAGRRRTR